MKFLATSLLMTVASLGLASNVSAAPKGCPPGLAKKSVPCVPPGQVKSKAVTHDNSIVRYQRGDVLAGDYVIIRDPNRYGLDPTGTYYRTNGQVYRVDQETREILDLIGAVTAILN